MNIFDEETIAVSLSSNQSLKSQRSQIISSSSGSNVLGGNWQIHSSRWHSFSRPRNNSKRRKRTNAAAKRLCSEGSMHMLSSKATALSKIRTRSQRSGQSATRLNHCDKGISSLSIACCIKRFREDSVAVSTSPSSSKLKTASSHPSSAVSVSSCDCKSRFFFFDNPPAVSAIARAII